MTDIAQGAVEIQHLMMTNSKLIGFMCPSQEQRDEVRRNCIQIAAIALQMAALYREH